MAQIIVNGEDFDGSKIGINGQIITIPQDVAFEASAEVMEVLTNAGVPFMTAPFNGGTIGQVYISNKYRGPRFLKVNGVFETFPVGVWFTPSTFLSELLSTIIPDVYILHGVGAGGGGGGLGPIVTALGELLPAFFAQFNGGVIPEAFSTAPQKYFFIIKSPPRVGTIYTNVSLDWQGDPIFASMSISDNDRTLDDDLDYDIYGKHPTDAAQHTFPGGVPYASFTKFKGGRRVRIQRWDTLGYPYTQTSGNGGTLGEQMDYRRHGFRGDYLLTTDADFVLSNGASSSSGPRPIWGSSHMVSDNQHGNNRDPYQRFNVPSSAKLTAPITSLVKDATTGVVTITMGSAFPDKQNDVGATYTAGGTAKVANGDFFEIDGSSYAGDTTPLTRFNWRFNVITFTKTSASGTVTNDQTTPASAPVYTLGGVWAIGDKIDLYLHGTRFTHTVTTGNTSLGNIAIALRALIAADGRFSGSTNTSTSVTVVSSAGAQTVFSTTIDNGVPHNIPAGAQSATGGTAYWFINRTPTNTSIGTHADGGQYDQVRYHFCIMEDLCTYKGNYDGWIGMNGVASDCIGQLTRINYEFKYYAPSDISSCTFRMGYTGGIGAFPKYVYQVYAKPRPLDDVARGIAFSANGNEGVPIVIDGLDAAAVPSRTEVSGVFKLTPNGALDFAPYANSGVDWVSPGESDVNPLAGVITDIAFYGSSTINESIGGGAAIGLIDVNTTNRAGDFDLSIMASNISLNHWYLHGRRLVRGRTQFDYETTPLIGGIPTASVTIRATLRGTTTYFEKTFYFPINNDVAASGNNVVATLGGHYFNGTPSSTTQASGALSIGAASAGRYVVASIGANASTSARDFGLTGVPVASGVTIGGTAAKRLVRRRKALDSNPNANFSFAGLFIAPIADAATTAGVVVGMGGSYAALALDVVAISGLSSDEPYSTAFAESGVSGAAVTVTLDMPTNGKAVLSCYYSTPTDGNKRTSTLVFATTTAGTFQIRATPAAGTFGPINWQVNTGTEADPVWSNLITWGAYDNVTTFTYAVSGVANGAVSASDGRIEDAGSGGTVLVAASFGAAT